MPDKAKIYLPRNEDADLLYADLIAAYGFEEASRIAKNLTGSTYEEVCAAFVLALSDADARAVFAK